MEKQISFEFTARYYTIGDLSSAKRIWFVLHGYGQLARFFIRKFKTLEEHGIAIIAPEGLSTFYKEDPEQRIQSGNTRVGAAWMTRDNRQLDIANYLQLLNAIYEKEIGATNVAVTIFGFSQGAATATRWALNGKVNFDELILWAGIFPPDIDFEDGHELLKNKRTWIVYGDKDPFLNDSRFAELNMITEKMRIAPTRLVFNGGHEIQEDALLTLIKQNYV